MVYMASLSTYAEMDLAEMQWIGSGDEVKIAAFMKQSKGANRRIVGRAGEDQSREDLGDIDTSKPETLLDFIGWAAKTAPAEKYALVLWNHEDAPGADADRDGTAQCLATVELGLLLGKAVEVLGQPIDLLGLDGWLLYSLEVGYQVRNQANVIVGSESPEPGMGWPYDRILEDLSAAPSIDAPGLGKLIVDRYAEFYQIKQAQWPVTQCATLSEAVERFAKIIDGLAEALKKVMSDNVAAAKILGAQAESATFPGALVDLNGFCNKLVADGVNPSVTDAAQAVMGSLKPGEFVLAEGHLGPQVEGCAGVTAYLPPPGSTISPNYKDLTFAQDHRWQDVLIAFNETGTATPAL